MIRIWTRVPNNCRLDLSVTSASDGVVASARVLDDQGKEIQWDDSKLRPGPAVLQIQSPRIYSVRIRLGFLEPAEKSATIGATIVKPNGQSFGKPFTVTVAGVNGDIVRADIAIATAAS